MSRHRAAGSAGWKNRTSDGRAEYGAVKTCCTAASLNPNNPHKRQPTEREKRAFLFNRAALLLVHAVHLEQGACSHAVHLEQGACSPPVKRINNDRHACPGMLQCGCTAWQACPRGQRSVIRKSVPHVLLSNAERGQACPGPLRDAERPQTGKAKP